MVRIALAQMDLAVGDIGGNCARIAEAIQRAETEGAQVVAVPELAVTGYPPEDLVLKHSFVDANIAALRELASETPDILAIIGYVDRDERGIYNAAAICQQGKVLASYRKQLLPNYGVFDEERYFEPGDEHFLFASDDGIIGVCICEDAWDERGPVTTQGDAGAQVIVNINASPFHKKKLPEREQMLAERARRAQAAIAYVNTVGGQDELVFDGGSLVIAADGSVVARLPLFEESFAVIDVDVGVSKSTHTGNVTTVPVRLREASGGTPNPVAEPLGEAEEIYTALRVALADYARKNRFEKVVIGLSGGIDSSMTAAIAADALGAESVLGVAMPSEFSSSHSIEDAKALAANLGIEMIEIPVASTYRAYLDAMKDAFGEADPGLAEENLQARIRGNLLMAISNRYGHLVLATGNKSEMACGYATLYGDMAGGFALLKDVFKTEVYELARYRNQISRAIPENVLTKPPSAELRPDQKDSDSLPPYERLDPILQCYVEQDLDIDAIVERRHDRETVEKVIALVDRAEYKRRQAPPGPKVTVKAFGRDRRLPISNQWGRPRGEMPERSVGKT